MVVEEPPFNPGWSEYFPVQDRRKVIKLGGETWAKPYTEPARVRIKQHLSAETFSSTYTEAVTADLIDLDLEALLILEILDTLDFSDL